MYVVGMQLASIRAAIIISAPADDVTRLCSLLQLSRYPVQTPTRRLSSVIFWLFGSQWLEFFFTSVQVPVKYKSKKGLVV